MDNILYQDRFTFHMKQKTLLIVKPDGVKKGLVGECIKRFENNGFEILALKLTKLSKPFVADFYKHLKPKLNPKLFKAIIEFMSSGIVAIIIAERDNAVLKAREICGATNPKEAKKGTIRADYSKEDLRINAKKNKATPNIIHASGSAEEAADEIRKIKKLL